MKKLLFILCLLVSGYASAGGAYCAAAPGLFSCASNPEAACAKYVSDAEKLGWHPNYEGMEQGSDGNTYCVVHINPQPSVDYFKCDYPEQVPRGGDGKNCGLPPDDYESPPEPPECEKDDLVPLRSPTVAITWPPGDKSPTVLTGAPDAACINQCRYTRYHDKFNEKCYLVPGSKDQGYCNFLMAGVGYNCAVDTPSNGDAVVGDPLPTTPPPICQGSDCKPEEKPEDKPKPEEKPEDKPKPEEKPTEGGETGGGGTGGGTGENGGSGGSSGGGGGGGSSGGNTNGGGNGNDNGTGSGEGEGGSGGGNGNGEGQGNGNGNGTCDPTKEECGEGEGSASGFNCNEPLECKGDVIQCAQLEKQKQIRCEQKELYELDDEKRKQLDDLVTKNTQEIPGFGGKDGETIDLSNTISKGSTWLPRGCPAPVNASVMGQTITFSFDYICQFAGWMSGIVVAIFSFLAIRIFGRNG